MTEIANQSFALDGNQLLSMQLLTICLTVMFFAMLFA